MAVVLGYKANLISTLVDKLVSYLVISGYKANLISTLVDSLSLIRPRVMAIRPI